MSTDDLAAIVQRVEALRKQLDEALDERDAIIRELLSTHSVQEIADMTGLTRQQVYYIRDSRRR